MSTRRRARLAALIPPVVLLTVLLVTWEALVRINELPRGLVPAPSVVLEALVGDLDVYLDNLGVTLLEIVLGFGLGVLVGLAAAIGITYSGAFARAVYPLILATQAVPIFAFAPLFIIWLGFGIEPKVVMVALGAFFPIVVNGVVGLTTVDPGAVALMRAYSASGWQLFRWLRLPNAAPFLVPAAEISMTYAVIGAVVAEWIGAESGIGRLMVAANATARTDQLFAAMLLITLVALALVAVVRLAGRWLTRWEWT
jgi:ABC-type nitrate/sulfonate/bicarbonate transport system permease component